MCRWNFMGLMQHPKIRHLDYYCRMDTDSRIRKKVWLPSIVMPFSMSSPCAASCPSSQSQLRLYLAFDAQPGRTAWPRSQAYPLATMRK